MRYWLFKSEPESYSIDDMARDKKTLWTGVRNYQARNFMTQSMKLGDQIIFYHSNASPAALVGLCEVSSAAQPDPTAFESKSDSYDPKATPEKPIWECVEVQFVQRFKRAISLDEVKKLPELSKMELLRKGNRLSIQPVTDTEFQFILGRQK